MYVTPNMRAISLFAGAGGDTLGMKMCGVSVVAYSEIDKDAIKSHDLNNQECVFLGDVTQIDAAKLEPYVGNIDILFAGFPCQGFSNAGKKLPGDPRNDLFNQVVRIANIIRPRLVIGENVAGILSRKNEQGEIFASVIYDKFQDIGYDVDHKVYNMSFCIPQMRKRVIFFCSDRTRPKIPMPEPLITRVNIRDFLQSVSSGGVPYTDLEELDITKIIRATSDADTKPHAMLTKMSNDKNITFGKRTPNTGEIIDLDNPTKTITCSYSFAPRLFVPVEMNDVRYLRTFTVRELARIQGFPDDYDFLGSKSSQIKQIGNAVPPLFVKFLISSILDYMM